MFGTPSRRTFLTVSALSAMVLTASPAVTDAIAAPIPDSWAALCERWVDIITGRRAARTSDPRAREIIAKADRKVTEILTDLASGSSRQTVLISADLRKEQSPFITKTARAIDSMACAWATPGSRYHKDPEILSACVEGL
ncbi:MAG: hyaluronate lyase, partial [Cutibacterium granulosum]|nr:hyaluronate lyase [Cutibacterium granulosum]